jgi:hypothetical protein
MEKLAATDFNVRSFAFDPRLSRGLAAASSDICAGIEWVTTDAVPAPAPISLHDGGRTSRLDETIRRPASADCTDEIRAAWPIWSPDGSRIGFFASPRSVGVSGTERLGEPWNLYVANADGRRPVVVVHDVAYPSSPVWSPDGRHVAFSGRLHGKAGGWLLDVKTNEVHRFTGLDLGDLDWSPDSHQIVATFNPTSESQSTTKLLLFTLVTDR